MHQVLVVTDWLGKTVQILHAGEEPPVSVGVTYTVAFESDDLGVVV